jgi:hypothetical protein
MELGISRQTSQILSFMKIRPVEADVGSDLFHADRQTDRQDDMKNLLVAFHNFANARKKSIAKNKFRRRHDVHCVHCEIYILFIAYSVCRHYKA